MPKKIWLIAASGWTLLIAVLCLVSFSDLPKVQVGNVDKYVHACFHFVFTVLWYLSLRDEDPRQSNVKTLLQVLVMSLFFGVLIEISQGMFTKTRNADVMDVAANFTGALAAVLILFCIRRFNRGATTKY